MSNNDSFRDWTETVEFTQWQMQIFSYELVRAFDYYSYICEDIEGLPPIEDVIKKQIGSLRAFLAKENIK